MDEPHHAVHFLNYTQWSFSLNIEFPLLCPPYFLSLCRQNWVGEVVLMETHKSHWSRNNFFFPGAAPKYFYKFCFSVTGYFIYCGLSNASERFLFKHEVLTLSVCLFAERAFYPASPEGGNWFKENPEQDTVLTGISWDMERGHAVSTPLLALSQSPSGAGCCSAARGAQLSCTAAQALSHRGSLMQERCSTSDLPTQRLAPCHLQHPLRTSRRELSLSHSWWDIRYLN